jgi:hypothetical protein
MTAGLYGLDCMDNFVVGEGIVYLVIWWEKSIVEATHESGLQRGENKNPKCDMAGEVVD